MLILPICHQKKVTEFYKLLIKLHICLFIATSLPLATFYQQILDILLTFVLGICYEQQTMKTTGSNL